MMSLNTLIRLTIYDALIILITRLMMYVFNTSFTEAGVSVCIGLIAYLFVTRKETNEV